MSTELPLFDRDEERSVFSYLTPEPLHFNGSAYVPEVDDARLTGQIARIFECMKDAKWRTLREIEEITGDPQASISCQLRHLRKPRFGSHTVNKRRRGNPPGGLWEYQLWVNEL